MVIERKHLQPCSHNETQALPILFRSSSSVEIVPACRGDAIHGSFIT